MRDIRTGEKLPLWQRGLTGAAMFVPFVSGGMVRSAFKGADEASEFIEQSAKRGDEVVQGGKDARLPDVDEQAAGEVLKDGADAVRRDTEGAGDSLKMSDKQFGKKVGKMQRTLDLTRAALKAEILSELR